MRNHWTWQEEARLLSLIAKGASFKKCSEILGRTIPACQFRFKKLELRDGMPDPDLIFEMFYCGKKNTFEIAWLLGRDEPSIVKSMQMHPHIRKQYLNRGEKAA